MYYITNGNEYYCGKCCSDNRTPVWKSCPTRALPFKNIESAMEKDRTDNICYLGIRFIVEDYERCREYYERT